MEKLFASLAMVFFLILQGLSQAETVSQKEVSVLEQDLRKADAYLVKSFEISLETKKNAEKIGTYRILVNCVRAEELRVAAEELYEKVAKTLLASGNPKGLEILLSSIELIWLVRDGYESLGEAETAKMMDWFLYRYHLAIDELEMRALIGE